MSPTPVGVIGSARVGVTGWAPTDLAGLAGWWDANDASTFTYSSGSLASEWRDKSGNGRHFGQGNTSKQPSRSTTINGKSAVAFNGSTTFMDNTISFGIDVPMTMLAVARNASTDSGQHELIIGKQGDGRVFYSVDGNISMNRGESLSTGVPWGVTSPHSVVALFNNAASKIATDSSGWTLGSSGATAFGNQGWRLGAYGQIEVEFWQGDVCEVVYVNGGITDAERDSWFAYTATKWGTA